MNYTAVRQSYSVGILINYIPAALLTVVRNMAFIKVIKYALVKIPDIIVV